MKKYNVLAVKFMASLKGVKTKKVKLYILNKDNDKVVNPTLKIYRVSSNEINNLLERYSKTTVKDIIGVYCKSLEQNNLKEVAMLLKTIFAPVYAEINNTYKEKLENRTDNARLVTNGAKVIEMAKRFMKSYDYKEIAVGLAILTGRRTSEILFSGKFSKIDGSHLLFSGQLKQNNSKAYAIPVLGNSDDIIKAVKNLRILREYASIEQVNAKDAKGLNLLVKNCFKSHCDGLTMHDLRRFYAYVSYHFIFHNEAKTGNRQTFGGYTKKILGHKVLKSGESYKTLEVEMS